MRLAAFCFPCIVGILGRVPSFDVGFAKDLKMCYQQMDHVGTQPKMNIGPIATRHRRLRLIAMLWPCMLQNFLTYLPGCSGNNVDPRVTEEDITGGCIMQAPLGHGNTGPPEDDHSMSGEISQPGFESGKLRLYTVSHGLRCVDPYRCRALLSV